MISVRYPYSTRTISSRTSPVRPPYVRTIFVLYPPCAVTAPSTVSVRCPYTQPTSALYDIRTIRDYVTAAAGYVCVRGPTKMTMRAYTNPLVRLDLHIT